MANKITFPHTIENGHGEKLVFLRLVKDQTGEWLDVENFVQPGAGPPMHVHFQQEESLTVVSGKIGYEILGGEKKYAGPGETVEFKRNVPHRFWNAGSDVLNCRGYIRPPGNVVYFLDKIYESTRNSKDGKPDAFDAAFLMNKYKSEFDMLGIPAFVRNVIFPISLFFGKLAGKHKKFADAPDAVKAG